MARVLTITRAPVEPVERYVSINPAARLRFEGLGARVARLRSTFAGSFTTPDKLADAKLLLVEIEREARLMREALK